MADDSVRKGWRWVPSAFFAEGAPFMVVSAVSAILLKSLGMDNTRLAFWTGLMMLPWSIKPLWAPFLDFLGTKRRWIIGCQLVMAILFGAAALLIGAQNLTALLIALFFLLALASATHDVAADGFYLIALDDHAQSFFAGIRSTFYRIATVCVQGGLVALAGVIETRGGSIRQGWALSLGIAAAVMAAIAVWHTFALPKVERANPSRMSAGSVLRAFAESWWSFLQLPKVWKLLLFLFFFRIAEAQLGKIAGVFLIDNPEAGGLGMSLAFQGFLYGTVGVIALTVGGILGGVWVAKTGFARTIWPLALAINLPDLVYVYLAATRPASTWLIGTCIAVEQFGYGLGYTGFMLVMLAATAHSGKFRTSHFAIMTAVGILALMAFGAISGWMQSQLGYLGFFWYVVIMTIPSYAVLAVILPEIPKNFGRKNYDAE